MCIRDRYWGHGHVNNDYPIGVSETPNGEYDVHLKGNLLVSGVRYDPDLKEAEDVFLLRRNGTVRARSIYFTPFEADKRKATKAGLGTTKGLHVLYSRLNEWSDVGIGSCYDAVDSMDEEQLELVKQMKSIGWRVNDGVQTRALSRMIADHFERLEIPERRDRIRKPLTVARRIKSGTVSYTHLTLPTICSV